ncbi:MarR family winged helix-turn-helix transcriptional regulator [Streptomyces sp. 8N114]|uniref:MarR family winged helix-turn-helix transcriptional regulator n=1 Tax=unclassified Streptomyces TaxID=2593676 RepID=UPI003FCEF74A
MSGPARISDDVERTVPMTPAPPDDLVAAPGYGARRMYQAYLAAWHRHVDSVLTGPQFAVLTVIHAYPDSDQSYLAGAVALDTSTMADVCRRLEKRDLIRRRPSTRDARRKLLSLTEQGETTLREINRRARRLDRALLGDDAGDATTARLLNTLGERWETIAALDELD